MLPALLLFSGRRFFSWSDLLSCPCFCVTSVAIPYFTVVTLFPITLVMTLDVVTFVFVTAVVFIFVGHCCCDRCCCHCCCCRCCYFVFATVVVMTAVVVFDKVVTFAIGKCCECMLLSLLLSL